MSHSPKSHIELKGGDVIDWRAVQPHVGHHPVILYIEGDGIGVDVTPVMLKVVDAAVATAFSGKRKICWHEIYAGEKAFKQTGSWLPQETIDAIQKFKIAIKGPLTTPIGGGIRSLNVALRQQLDLYQCVRPIVYFPGAPSPVVHPDQVDMVLFRENSEDIYAGIEWQAGSQEADQLISYLKEKLGVQAIRFPEMCGIGIKPISEAGTKRLVRAAIQYAIDHQRQSVTLVHKGNIMKFTEGAFQQWGFSVATQEFGAKPWQGGPWLQIKRQDEPPLIIKDSIADAFLQNILLRPDEFDVIATTNLNGDYFSDALAAMVGGIGIAPGANIGEKIALFEATHGTAPKYAGLDKVNPGSLILSAEMMLRLMGWSEAADLIISGFKKLFLQKIVTYDFARMMTDAKEVTCSGFGDELIKTFAD